MSTQRVTRFIQVQDAREDPVIQLNDPVVSRRNRAPARCGKPPCPARLVIAFNWDGRIVLGVGSGFRQAEYDGYGFPFGTPGERVRQLKDGLARIELRDCLRIAFETQRDLIITLRSPWS